MKKFMINNEKVNNKKKGPLYFEKRPTPRAKKHESRFGRVTWVNSPLKAPFLPILFLSSSGRPIDEQNGTL